jgi:hypothetical protein
VDLEELTRVLVQVSGDLNWLNDSVCADMAVGDFFVEAGHIIDEKTLNVCRTCPVRRDCLTHAYRNRIIGGYFGGLSPGQRRDMDIDTALVFISKDPPRRLG